MINKKRKAIDNTLLKNTTDSIEVDDIDIDFSVTVPEQMDDADGDVVYVKYVPPRPDKPVPLIYPREKYKKRVKQIRKKKEDYRKRSKKRVIQTLIKKKNAADKNTLLNFPYKT